MPLDLVSQQSNYSDIYDTVSSAEALLNEPIPQESKPYVDLSNAGIESSSIDRRFKNESKNLFFGVDSVLSYDKDSKMTGLEDLESTFVIPELPSSSEVQIDINDLLSKTESDFDFSKPEDFLFAVESIKVQSEKYVQVIGEMIQNINVEVSSAIEKFYKHVDAYNKDKTSWFTEEDKSSADMYRERNAVYLLIEKKIEELEQAKKQFENLKKLEEAVFKASKEIGFVIQKLKEDGEMSIESGKEMTKATKEEATSTKSLLESQKEALENFQKKIRRNKSKLENKQINLNESLSADVNFDNQKNDIDNRIVEIERQLNSSNISSDEKQVLELVLIDLQERKGQISLAESNAESSLQNIQDASLKLSDDIKSLTAIEKDIKSYLSKIDLKFKEIEEVIAKCEMVESQIADYEVYFAGYVGKMEGDVLSASNEAVNFHNNEEQRMLATGELRDSNNWEKITGRKGAQQGFIKEMNGLKSSVGDMSFTEHDGWDKSMGVIFGSLGNGLSYLSSGISSVVDFPRNVLKSWGAPSWMVTGLDVMMIPIHVPAGFTQGALGIVEGLSGILKEPGVAWEGMKSLVGAGDVSAGEAWEALGKGMIYYDEFSFDNLGQSFRAVGKVGTDVVLTVVTAGAGGAAVKSALTASRTLKGVSKLRALYKIPFVYAWGNAKDFFSMGVGLAKSPFVLTKGVGRALALRYKSLKNIKFGDNAIELGQKVSVMMESFFTIPRDLLNNTVLMGRRLKQRFNKKKKVDTESVGEAGAGRAGRGAESAGEAGAGSAGRGSESVGDASAGSAGRGSESVGDASAGRAGRGAESAGEAGAGRAVNVSDEDFWKFEQYQRTKEVPSFSIEKGPNGVSLFEGQPLVEGGIIKFKGKEFRVLRFKEKYFTIKSLDETLSLVFSRYENNIFKLHPDQIDGLLRINVKVSDAITSMSQRVNEVVSKKRVLRDVLPSNAESVQVRAVFAQLKNSDEWLRNQGPLVKNLFDDGFIPSHVFEQGDLRMYYSSPVLDQNGRPIVVAYAEKNGELSRRVFYRSNSDGTWRGTPGFDRVYSKGLGSIDDFHYTQTTKVAEQLADAFDNLTLNTRSLRVYDGGDIIIKYFHKESPYSNFQVFAQESKNIRISEFSDVNSWHLKPGYALDDANYPGKSPQQLVQVHVDAVSIIENRGVLPDFRNNPTREYKIVHSLISENSSGVFKKDIKVEVFETQLNGRVVEWHMASSPDGNYVWADKIRFKDQKVTSFGTDSEVLDTGVLTSKPIEHQSQVSGLSRSPYVRSVSNGDYFDISRYLDELPHIKNYRINRNIRRVQLAS